MRYVRKYVYITLEYIVYKIYPNLRCSKALYSKYVTDKIIG